MAVVGSVTVSAIVTGGPTGDRTFTKVIPISAGVGESDSIALSSGFNTITPPTGATVIIIFGPNATTPQPNPASTVTLTLKGITGDTGISISSQYPTVVPIGTLPATFGITASGTSSCEIFYA